MAILICGGAGYIGSHTNKMFTKAGYDTVVMDSLVNGHREAVKWGGFVRGDLACMNDIEAIFNKFEIEAVLHLAAFAYVGESVREPEKYYYNNVVNTLNLLKVMRKYSCNKIIFSSTCATYGEPDRLPIEEDMPQVPINTYGTTKLMVEQILNDYGKSYGLKYVILRYFNAAGADPNCEIGESHEPETHIIPLSLDAAAGLRDNITVFGTDYDTPDGSCVRDFIHVVDLAEAHLLSYEYLKKGEKSDSFNLGNEQGTSVLELINIVKNITKRNFSVVYDDRRAGDPPILMGSSKKAKEFLGWKPRYRDIETIVQHAWNWHENKKF